MGPHDLHDLTPDRDRMRASYIPIMRNGLLAQRGGLSVQGDIFGSTSSAIRLPQVHMRWGKLDEALAAGGQATMSVWVGTDGHWDGWEQDSNKNIEVYCPPTAGGYSSGAWVLVARVGRRWVVVEPAADELYWCMLMEDHPGMGVCFDILVGQWCPDEYKHRFDCDSVDYEVGIDWAYTETEGGSIPEPAMYAQGWFKRQPATYTASGYVYVVVSLDCDSRGICAGGTGTGPDTDGYDLPCITGTDPCGGSGTGSGT